MNPFDEKICEAFAGVVVRKDLVKEVKGNAIVPAYVLEYLLGQYCATSDETSIQAGIESVRKILQEHYVHRNEAGLVRSTIKEKGRHKVIDKVSVNLNDREGVYEAEFANLGIKKVLVPVETIKKNPKLLVNGIWSIVGLEYLPADDPRRSPWTMESLKPIQLARFDKETFCEARRKFSLDEWIDLLIQSMGFNPEFLGPRNKMFQLTRLLPYCERNYNLIELGPKGTGKSHIYSEFSPHGILLSGGEVTVPKLFVNNANGKIGLVGYWDAIAFDEFAGKMKRPDKKLVDIMKNYMANKSFSRGIDTLSAEASMIFVGNTQHNVPYMLKHNDLFDELPKEYHDSAFLDRIHYYIPGWEVDIIRGEMFSQGYGFIVDYLAEVLRTFRDEDRSGDYKEFFSLDPSLSTRDRDAIQKTVSGFLKLLYPNRDANQETVEKILRFAVEGRKRVKDQIMRFDDTYARPRFQYTDQEGNVYPVQTLEEIEYPQYYYQNAEGKNQGETPTVSEPEFIPEEKVNTVIDSSSKTAAPQTQIPPLKEGSIHFAENKKGVSFEKILIPYLRGAVKIEITDSYLRNYWQIRNLMELLTELIKIKPLEEEICVHIITGSDENSGAKQIDFFEKMTAAVASAGIRLTFAVDPSIHDRQIVTNTGWKIILGRGLDIFQNYDGNDTFSLQNTLQTYRACKDFNVTYVRMAEDRDGLKEMENINKVIKESDNSPRSNL